MSASVRDEVTKLKCEEASISEKIKLIQDECPHETSVYSAHGSSGNWDNEDSYWYCMKCYDCGKQWSHDQDRPPSGKLRVDRIDYTEQPEIIELQIQIEKHRK